MAKTTTTFTFRRSAIWEGNVERFGDDDAPYVLTVEGSGPDAEEKAKRVIRTSMNRLFPSTRKKTPWDGKPQRGKKAAAGDQQPVRYNKGLGQRFILVANDDHDKVLDAHFIG